MTLRYWDSCCFLGWFMNEPDRVATCQGVVQAAEAGRLQIVTSALTLTEVIKLKGHEALKADNEKAITAFFQNEFIVLRNVDRFIAEYARELIWTYPALKPKDSIHVATALFSAVESLDTYDDGLLALDGSLGDPPLRIGEPNEQYQTVIEVSDDEQG